MKNRYTYDYRTILLLLLLLPLSGLSQVVISDYEPNAEPNPDAILELRSLNHDKSLLMPKAALTATNVAAPFSAHVTGMTVYNTQTAGTRPFNVEPGFYYNDGTSWKRISINRPVIGDVKNSAATADHHGWYLLNGRAVATLPPAAAAYAAGLGFGVNLPNAANRLLKTRQGAEILGSVAGSAGIAIAQANFPVFTFATTVSTSGFHAHTYNDRASGTGQSSESSAVQTVVDNTNGSGNTSSNGAHTHIFTVSTGGSGQAIPFKPPYLVTNVFVYLGSH